MRKLKIESGKRYGKLVIIEKHEGILLNKKGRPMTTGQIVKCQCDCGKETLKPLCWIKRGATKSCGCSQAPKKNESSNWKGYEEISGDFWGGIRRSANTRKIKFRIKIESAWKKFIEQDRKCALSGEPINFGTTNIDKKCNASLDRIDSQKDYTDDNIQWVTKEINVMKMDLDEKRFLSLCQSVVEYTNNKYGQI